MKYIKVERKNHDDYYYQRADRCTCDSLKGSDFDECMYCSLRANKIADYLRRNEEDFWDERHLRGTSKKSFKRRIREGHEVVTIS